MDCVGAQKSGRTEEKDCPLPGVIGSSLLNCKRYRPVNDIILPISYTTARSGRRTLEVTFTIEGASRLKKPGMISADSYER